MNNNQQFKPPSTQQVVPPEYNPSKKPLFLVIGFVITIVLILVLIVFWGTRNKTPEQPQPTKVPSSASPTATPYVSISPSTTEAKKSLIVYLKENNIWSVKSDGTSLKQLTRDGDSTTIRYQALTFKGAEDLSFARCQSPDFVCEIVSKNLASGEEKVVYDPKENISAISWDEKGSILAYIGNSIEGVPTLTSVTDGTPKKTVVFEPGLGRGGGLDDEVSLTFSPDGKYLLVVNTVTQPNLANNETTIWVVNTQGEIVTSINKKFATDAIWDTSTTFIYRSAASVFRKNVTGSEQELASLEGVDISLSTDKKNIIFWATSDSGVTATKTYSLESKTTTEVRKDLIYSRFANKNIIIGVKTTPSTDSYFGFSTQGLVSYNLLTQEEHLLDSSTSISQFIVQE